MSGRCSINLAIWLVPRVGVLFHPARSQRVVSDPLRVESLSTPNSSYNQIFRSKYFADKQYTQIKLSSLKKVKRSGRNGIWDVYVENDPENIIVKVLETQFHVFTLKNFRNYAGIMLHPSWLKQHTHDYDGIIYLSLSVTVLRFQLRSFSLFCLPQTVLDLENFYFYALRFCATAQITGGIVFHKFPLILTI